jgi:tol-pal system protein YbgF
VRWITVGPVLLVCGCALKGDVRRVENQVIALREETARADSARAVMLARALDELDDLARAVADSAQSQRRALLALQGQMRSDLTEVQRQLVAIQELTGQSQARLNDLRRRLDTRPETVTAAPGDSTTGTQPQRGPGPEELYTLGIEQLRQRSYVTARTAFRELLARYGNHERAADAQYFLGDTFETENPDSAVVMWEAVVEHYPESRRAPAALYKLGLFFEQHGDQAAARLRYNRLLVAYPQSEEAELARAKLRNP